MLYYIHSRDADFRVLVERGTNIRHSDIYGKTALMNAALNEDPRLDKLLLGWCGC
jgi:ankyrin repeat protein